MTVNPEELEALAVDIATTAGHRIRLDTQHRGHVTHVKTSNIDIVTEMDTDTEKFIRERLHNERPEDAVLGEEGGQHEGASSLTWIIDPIDGTVNYLYGLPDYAVSIAVARTTPTGTETLAACVHRPSDGATWHAHRGGGARLNEKPIRVNSSVNLDMALVATGFGYDRQARVLHGQVLAGLLPQIRDVRRMGSAALDLCAVASGHLDAYYESGLHAWDMAAGALIVEEAGGVVLGPRQRVDYWAPVIAGEAHIVQELEAILRTLSQT